MSPFALYNFLDGAEPSARYVGGREETEAGEVYSEAHPSGMVWDAASGKLREKTLPERAREFRAERKREISLEAKGLTEPLFAIGFAEEEFQALTAAKALGQPADPRLLQAVEVMGRVRTAYGKLDAVPDDDPDAFDLMRGVSL